MNPTKKTATIMGVYFLAAYVLGISGIVLSRLFDPSFTALQNLLTAVSENSIRIKFSIFCDLFATVSVVGLTTTLFITLKDQNKQMAWLGLGCWLLYASVGLASRIHVFSLLQLSQEYSGKAAQEADYFFTLGHLTVGAANSGYLILSFFFRMGGLAFYYLFFTSRLVPRFLSVWGLLAMVLGMGSFFLEFFNYYPGNLDTILSIPNVLFEPFIGIWLIVKGFNTPGKAETSRK